jgi:hypothetical protein
LVSVLRRKFLIALIVLKILPIALFKELFVAYRKPPIPLKTVKKATCDSES